MAKNIEQFATPVGNIRIITHRSGYFDIREQRFVPGTVFVESREYKNVIVDQASVLMAGRMCPANYTYGGNAVSTITAGGLKYLALGTGLGTSVDPLVPEPDTAGTEYLGLRNEIFRKAFDATNGVCYLNASTSNSQLTPSNKLQLTTIFAKSEAICGSGEALVEMGLIGGDVATTSPSPATPKLAAQAGEYLFNYKTFPAVTKDADMLLTVIWTITF